MEHGDTDSVHYVRDEKVQMMGLVKLGVTGVQCQTAGLLCALRSLRHLLERIGIGAVTFLIRVKYTAPLAPPDNSLYIADVPNLDLSSSAD